MKVRFLLVIAGLILGIGLAVAGSGGALAASNTQPLVATSVNKGGGGLLGGLLNPVNQTVGAVTNTVSSAVNGLLGNSSTMQPMAAQVSATGNAPVANAAAVQPVVSTLANTAGNLTTVAAPTAKVAASAGTGTGNQSSQGSGSGSASNSSGSSSSSSGSSSSSSSSSGSSSGSSSNSGSGAGSTSGSGAGAGSGAGSTSGSGAGAGTGTAVIAVPVSSPDQTASQQVITAIGGAQQNPCGNNTASLLFVTQQDFGECADQGSLGVAGAANGTANGAVDQTASQQTITAIGGAQQNPCGNNTASLFFVTQQDFGECADQGSAGVVVPAANAAAGNAVLTSGAVDQTASQQVITAIGGAQQNPCGNNTASLLFVTQQDFGQCADQGSAGVVVPAANAAAGNAVLASSPDQTASQQVITAIGGAQQNPCGNNTASLLFVTQQDFGECADQGSLGVAGAANGTANGAVDQTASQQTITAIGGAQQNPCGSNTASLLFVTQQDFGQCADQGSAGVVGSTTVSAPANGAAAGNGSSAVVVTGNGNGQTQTQGSGNAQVQGQGNGGVLGGLLNGIPVVGGLANTALHVAGGLPVVGGVVNGVLGGGSLPVVGNLLGGVL